VRIAVSLAFAYHLSAAKEDRRVAHGASFIFTEAAKESGFGPLKALLGAISAVYTDREVRKRFLT
jgi:hypothetical protein